MSWQDIAVVDVDVAVAVTVAPLIAKDAVVVVVVVGAGMGSGHEITASNQQISRRSGCSTVYGRILSGPTVRPTSREKRCAD